MKMFFLPPLLACSTANAQVIKCPATFPYETAKLASDNKEIVEPARLSRGGGISENWAAATSCEAMTK